MNAKAGACSENCSFCSQSAHYQTGSPKYGFVDPEPVQAAAEEAGQNQVTAVGLVAAWKGLTEGPLLDEICDRVRELKATGKTRPDVSLGIIKNQSIADRLKEAGVECYGHNLESSRRFFPQTCSTHTFEDRLETIGYLKKAGIKICSGGIIGMGETREDRCDLAFTLKEVGANVVPINILNPIPGTPFADMPRLPVLEILKTIACFRFILPRQEIMIAGGRTMNLRDAQSMIFMAGASAMRRRSRMRHTLTAMRWIHVDSRAWPRNACRWANALRKDSCTASSASASSCRRRRHVRRNDPALARTRAARSSAVAGPSVRAAPLAPSSSAALNPLEPTKREKPWEIGRFGALDRGR